MRKISAFEKYDDPTICHEQVVYLNYNGVDKQTIAKITGYAISTVKTFIYKFADLLSKAKKRFLAVTKKALKEVEPAIEYVKNVPNRFEAKVHNDIIIERVSKNYEKGNSYAYVFTFFNSCGKPQFLKIGKSDTPLARLQNEIPYYRKRGIDVSYAVINKLFLAPSGDRALTIENALREHYKKQSFGYLRNDRFLDMAYDVNDLRQDSFLKNTVRLCCAV